MVEEKRDYPEIEHGSEQDDGAARATRTKKPCSNRLQGEHGIYWCQRATGHEGECEGVPPKSPIVVENGKTPRWG